MLASRWTWNLALGRYYKIPPYTILGFADNAGTLVNKNAAYIRSDHMATGFEFLPSPDRRFTLEGFYKRYAHVPVSVRNGISLSNLGGDFNVLGNEAVTSTGKGRTYGIEFFAQQKLTRRFLGILSYTYFRSQYSGADGNFIASAWENNHLLSLTMGYKLNRNWELGLKFRYQGGAPYTPFDEAASRLNYLSVGTGILDYTQLNTRRLQVFNASDLRVDKKWNFKKLTLDAFIDLQNWYTAPSPGYPQYTFKRNEANTDFVTTDGAPSSRMAATPYRSFLKTTKGASPRHSGLSLSFETRINNHFFKAPCRLLLELVSVLLMSHGCLHRFAKIWNFEKVFNLLSSISNRAKVWLKFFEYPYIGKPFLVSGDLQESFIT